MWQEVLRVRWLEEIWEPTTFMRGLTWEKRHSSAPNVTIASLNQSARIIKGYRTPTVEEIWVHKVWHELLRIRWIEEKWENHTEQNRINFCAQSVARGSLGQMNWSNMLGLSRKDVIDRGEGDHGEGACQIMTVDDRGRRGAIQVHQMCTWLSSHVRSSRYLACIFIDLLGKLTMYLLQLS